MLRAEDWTDPALEPYARALMFDDGERLSVGQIVAASPLSRSAVAHHLRVLREAGILRCEKVGKEVW